MKPHGFNLFVALSLVLSLFTSLATSERPTHSTSSSPLILSSLGAADLTSIGIDSTSGTLAVPSSVATSAKISKQTVPKSSSVPSEKVAPFKVPNFPKALVDKLNELDALVKDRAPVLSVKDYAKKAFGPLKDSIADLFKKPISLNEPLSVFPRDSHETSGDCMSVQVMGKLGIPTHTNKFGTNLIVGNRDQPVFSMPYEVWWNNEAGGDKKHFGMGFDYQSPSRRIIGDVDPDSQGSIKFYANPVKVMSLSFSATEFSPRNSTLEVRNFNGGSVDTVIYADKEKSMLDKRMDMPLCQGMGFVTSNFIGLTPLMISDHGVINMTRVDYKPNVTKYRVGLGNKSVWVLYAFHARNTTPLELKQKDGDKILATGPFTGFIQAAKVEVTGTVGGVTSDDIEAALDKSAGSYCSYVAYTSSVKNNVGYYEFHFGQRGIKSQKKNMLMFALPHLVESFAPETQARSNPKFTMLSAAKGPMVAVIGAVWRMVEKELPVNIGWNPLSNGTSDISPGNLKLIAATAKQEIDEYVLTEPSDHDTKSLYHSGKRLHKYAQLCLATSEVLNDESLVKKCWDQLKDHFGFFAANLQRDKLLYDITWRGIISEAVYRTGDINVDYGSTQYNDHHFHHSYFVYAAAIIGHLENKHFKSGKDSWLEANREYVNVLIRDVANPSGFDNYFPVFRNFDWFHGHSWAKGLFESGDGKDEESSSEDAHFYYAMKMWGHISGDADMEARGNLILAILKRSFNNYFYLKADNKNHPEDFVLGMISGILFENKVHRITYFGDKQHLIHGIHMIPFTPITKYLKDPEWVRAEWEAFFSTPEKYGVVEFGWNGLLYSNLALIDPVKSFNYFKVKDFDKLFLDEVASLTYSLAYAAQLGGAKE